jgi:high-affinity nickel permease
MNYLFINYTFSWLKERIKERTTLDGTVLILISIAMLVIKPLINVIALVAIIYGLWTIVKGEKNEKTY